MKQDATNVTPGAGSQGASPPQGDVPTTDHRQESEPGLLDRLGVGTYEAGRDGKLRHANVTLLRLLAYSDVAALRRGIATGKDTDGARASFLATVATMGEVRDVATTWYRRDGSPVTVHESAWTLRDEQGAVRGFAGIVRPFGGCGRATAKAACLFQQAVDQSPNPIFSVNREGLIETWNAACTELLGHGVEIIGKHYRQLLCSEEMEALVPRLVAHVFEGATLSNVELCFRGGAGRMVHTDSRLYPITDDEDQVLACVFANTDVSMHRYTEQALWRRERILRAVTYAAGHFLQGDPWRDGLQSVLQQLGEATGVSRVSLFENERSGGRVGTSARRCEWTAPDVPSLLHDPRHAVLNWEEEGLSRWRSLLREGELVYGCAATFPAQEQALLAAQDVRSTVVIPVFTGEQWWGVIGLSDCERERRWTASELDALRIAASTLGTAIARHAAEEQLRRRNRELVLLNRVIAAATSSLEAVTVLQITCRELAQALGVPQAGAALLDESGEFLKVVTEFPSDGDASALGARIPIAENPSSEYVVQHKKPLVIDDALNDPRLAPVVDLMRRRRVASILILPIFVGDEVVGTLGLDAMETHFFSADDVSLAMSALNAATQVLEKARLLTAEQENAARLARVLQLTSKLATVDDEQVLLETFVKAAAAFSGTGACTIFLVEEGANAFVMAAQHGLGASALGQQIPFALSFVQRILEDRDPLLVVDIDEVFPQLRRLLVRDDVRAFFAYPIVADETVIGFFTLSDRYPRRPSVAEVNALRLLAERLAAAFLNVRFLSAIRAQAAQLETLHDVDVAITTSLEPEEVYGKIVEGAAGLTHCDLVNLFLWDESAAEYEGLATYGGPALSVKGQRFPVELSGLVPALVRDGETLVIPDADADARVKGYWRRRFGVKAALAVPLAYREQLIGFLVCADTARARAWRETEVHMAESLAALAAIAVANARLHARTRTLLAQSQQQARAMQGIVDTVPEGILVLDGASTVVLANPAAQQYLEVLDGVSAGQSLAQLGSEPLATFLGPPPEGALCHEVQVAGRVFEIVARPIERGAQSGGWVLLLHEVTKEREQQAYLSTQERLATVGQLAAGIAHDFNNIMSVIVLYSQALQQSDMAVRDRERLVAIYHQARRAASLISQILDFSRRAIVARHEFNLLPFLKELVQLFERTLPETITIELEAGRDPYVVNADPTRLQQALMNLAVNARDAMPRGGKLLIRLHQHDLSWDPPLPDMHARAWLHLAVADTGCGIAAQHLAHIFEPFFTTKAPGEGTGLGLAQVYGIVKQHDGFIDVESAAGKGTTFHIYLPAASSPPLEMPAEPSRLHLAHGETLLVVEDDPTTLQALQETLRTWGYHVLTATNGQEALEQYRAHEAEIALVLSDMVMPRLNGTGLLQELRQRNPAAKIVLFTGYPLDEKGRSLISDSGAVWVQKPFTGEKIASVVQRMLEEETA